MENQHTSVVTEREHKITAQIIFFKNEIQKLSHQELIKLKADVEKLCLEFDPYSPSDRSDFSQHLIDDLGLENCLDNPFTFTNAILQILDDIEN